MLVYVLSIVYMFILSEDDLRLSRERDDKVQLGADLAVKEVLPAPANLRTKILDFRGFAASRILSLRGGILLPTGNFPEMLNRRILAGVILVGRSGAFPIPGDLVLNMGAEASSRPPDALVAANLRYQG